MDINTKHCMIDLEWLGKPPYAAISAIAGVIFIEETNLDARDSAGNPFAPHFYVRVDPRTSEAIGMTLDADTVLWWLGQNDAARAEMVNTERTPIITALKNFAQWYSMHGCAQLWGNGSDADNVVLDCAYQLAQKAGHKDVVQPWTFRSYACYRTTKKLFPSIQKGLHNPVAHHALEDAIFQAKAAQKALRAVRMVNEILEREAK